MTPLLCRAYECPFSLDIFDSQGFFSSHVPIKTLESPLLRYSALAVAAKQYGKIIRQDALNKLAEERIADTQVFQGYMPADWSYQAVTYSDKAVSYLQLYIQQAVPSHAAAKSEWTLFAWQPHHSVHSLDSAAC